MSLNLFNRLSFNKLGGATQLPFLSLLSEKNRLKCTCGVRLTARLIEIVSANSERNSHEEAVTSN